METLPREHSIAFKETITQFRLKTVCRFGKCMNIRDNKIIRKYEI